MKTDSNNQLPNREEIKKRLEALGITQRYLSKFHKRKPQQITQALNGEQPGLLSRILMHIEKLEANKQSSEAA
jgi:predicted transcriptional regulator